MENIDRMADEVANIYDENSAGGNYPEEVKTASGTSNVVRILNGSSSFKKYLISWFLCDDDQIRPFIIENDTEGRGALSRILGDSEQFYRGGYLESKKGQFGKVNVHQAKDPELFKRLTEYWNPAYNGSGTCRPSKEFVYNVIHRNPDLDEKGAPVNWCVMNKHTKLMRFKQRAFKSLKVVRDNCGEFDTYDVVFSKQGSGSDTFFSAMKADVMTQHNKVGDVSAEEKEYEKYDLAYITRLTSANYILTNLHGTVERIDAVMGTTYLAELLQQKEYEDKMYEQNKSGGVDMPPQNPVPPSTGIQAQQTPTNSRIPVAQEAPKPVTRIPVANVPTVECGHCHQQIPDNLEKCPKCGGNLVAPCEICQKPFSVFVTTCPHCGQIYKTS
jgi:hypothetical protein